MLLGSCAKTVELRVGLATVVLLVVEKGEIKEIKGVLCEE
jgi:hypothetical protein